MGKIKDQGRKANIRVRSLSFSLPKLCDFCDCKANSPYSPRSKGWIRLIALRVTNVNYMRKLESGREEGDGERTRERERAGAGGKRQASRAFMGIVRA